MLGFRFIKAIPTTYVMHAKKGRIVRQGAGQSFFYFAPTATIILIPLNAIDVPFVFTEDTADHQPITIQGQFSYRVKDPEALSKLLDYSVNFRGVHNSDDPDKLPERLTGTAQVLAKSVFCKLNLEQALAVGEESSRAMLSALQASPTVSSLGIEILDFNIMAVRPTPEMARALEAHTRESLQQRADQAIFERRNKAVDAERAIKENELNTDIAVEEKKRVIRERQMEADRAVEEARTKIVEQKVTNDKKEAESRAYALEVILEPIKQADWKNLTAAFSGGMSAELMIATAFRELADNAQKIGEVNMSSELLTSLIKPAKK